MSVILTGLRRRQEGDAKAKSKPKKHEKYEPTRKTSTASQSMPTNSYVPSETVAVWNFIMNKVQISVALMKETFDVWVNDVEVETEVKEETNAVTVSFDLFDKVATIRTTSDDGRHLHHEMRVDNRVIPEFMPR